MEIKGHKELNESWPFHAIVVSLSIVINDIFFCYLVCGSLLRLQQSLETAGPSKKWLPVITLLCDLELLLECIH